MAATAAQLITRVKGSIEDPNDKFFGTEDYVRVYNDALDEISELTEINESSIYVKRRKSAVYTDLRGILPPTFLRVTSVWNPATGKWLDPLTVRELDDTIGRHWEERPDSSRWWFMRGLWFLGTYPVPSDDATPVKIWYTSLLPHVDAAKGNVGGTSGAADIPPDFDVMIENYMMYELLAERKEVDKSLQFYQRFTTQVGQLKGIAEARMSRDRTPRMGAKR